MKNKDYYNDETGITSREILSQQLANTDGREDFGSQVHILKGFQVTYMLSNNNNEDDLS